jgi:Cytochrome C biogenesis protein
VQRLQLLQLLAQRVDPNIHRGGDASASLGGWSAPAPGSASKCSALMRLRRQVREMLQQGRSEREILDYMTARYGDFVLYNPPLKPSTALLWFGPVLLLVGGMTVLVLILRRRSRMSAEHFDAEPGAGTDQPPSDADASPPR